MQLINPSTSPNELNTTLTPHSIIHGDACFAYFNKIWGIPYILMNAHIRSGAMKYLSVSSYENSAHSKKLNFSQKTRV